MDWKGSLTDLIVLAYQYGPFFFAVWIIGFINKRAHKLYNESGPDQLNTYRLNFIAWNIFSVVLVILAIGWWFLHPPSTRDTSSNLYTFSGQIVDLKEYELLASKQLFFRTVPQKQLRLNSTPLHDEHFLIVSEKPFMQGQEFDLTFSKGENYDDVKLKLKYSSTEKLNYEIKFDPKARKHSVNAMTTAFSSGVWRSMFLGSAFAAENLGEGSRIKTKKSELSNVKININIITNLQNERTDVGTKISLLRKLESYETKTLKSYLEFKTSKEPMVLTVLDLSRHTDSELAYFANELISKFDLIGYAKEELVSTDKKRRDAFIEMLFRIPPKIAMDLIGKLPPETPIPRKEKLVSDLEKKRKSKILIPTGSKGGDRYYVKATYNPKKPKVVECLASLFNQELIGHERTLAQEIQLMEKRSKRFVYWYTKEWALYITEEIEDCGAIASFTNGNQLK